MARPQLYRIATQIERLCAVVDASVPRVMRRAGLPQDYCAHETRGLAAAQCFALWDAALDDADRQIPVVDLGRKLAHGSFVSSVLAFSCSPTVETGLQRLAVFKSLVGPIRLTIRRSDDRMDMDIQSADMTAALPDSMAIFEIAYFIELIRAHTARNIEPLRITLPGNIPVPDDLAKFSGAPILHGPTMSLQLSDEDARARLISENAELWAFFEPNLRRKMAAQAQDTPLASRVRGALMLLMPAGHAGSEQVCSHLNISKRSLQRHLRGEGTSYQQVLDETRAELARHYLREKEITIEEISYLLAYRDPNSFYRAFNGWTGTTPMQLREQLAAEAV